MASSVELSQDEQDLLRKVFETNRLEDIDYLHLELKETYIECSAKAFYGYDKISRIRSGADPGVADLRAEDSWNRDAWVDKGHIAVSLFIGWLASKTNDGDEFLHAKRWRKLSNFQKDMREIAVFRVDCKRRRTASALGQWIVTVGTKRVVVEGSPPGRGGDWPKANRGVASSRTDLDPSFDVSFLKEEVERVSGGYSSLFLRVESFEEEFRQEVTDLQSSLEGRIDAIGKRIGRLARGIGESHGPSPDEGAVPGWFNEAREGLRRDLVSELEKLFADAKKDLLGELKKDLLGELKNDLRGEIEKIHGSSAEHPEVLKNSIVANKKKIDKLGKESVGFARKKWVEDLAKDLRAEFEAALPNDSSAGEDERLKDWKGKLEKKLSGQEKDLAKISMDTAALLEEATATEPWEMDEIKEPLAQERQSFNETVKQLKKRYRDPAGKYSAAATELDELDGSIGEKVKVDSPVRKRIRELEEEIEQPLGQIEKVFKKLRNEKDMGRHLMALLFFRDRIADIDRRLGRLEEPALFGDCVQHELRVRDLALSKAGKALDGAGINPPVKKLLELAGLTQILPEKGAPMLTKCHSMDGEERSDVPRGHIYRVKQRGFSKDGKVLLKAQVVLSKGR